MSFLEFFNTAPKVKSEKVVRLEKIGQGFRITQAVDAERKATNHSNIGSDAEGKITVRRVGAFKAK